MNRLAKKAQVLSKSISSNRSSYDDITNKISNDEHVENIYKDILNDNFNEEYLKDISGTNDLTKLTSIQLKIDTNSQSIYEIHLYLPKLESLILDHSIISSIRDLGTGLRYIKYLSLYSCGLYDLDGISVFSSLEELNIEDNFLTELSSLAMHETLQRLNVSGNNIKDLSVADTLSTCSALKSLSLIRNPITKATHYRLVIASLIPTLIKLDGLPIDSDAAVKVSNGMILEAAESLRICDDYMDDEKRLELTLLEDPNFINLTNNSELSSYKSNSNISGKSHGSDVSSIPDTGSELTHGSDVVLAGNVAVAMRQRRQGSSKSTVFGNSNASTTTLSAIDLFDKYLDSHYDVDNVSSFENTQTIDRNSCVDVNLNGFVEGDITESYRDNHTPNKFKHRSKRNQIELKSNSNVRLSTSDEWVKHEKKDIRKNGKVDLPKSTQSQVVQALPQMSSKSPAYYIMTSHVAATGMNAYYF